MSTEVASTRLPREVVRELDQEAAARGISRSVYVAGLIEQRASGRIGGSVEAEGLRVALAGELREIREGQRSLARALREIQTALAGRGVSGAPVTESPLTERLTFSAFFSEALIKRMSALLNRHPGELGQVVREAREQADAEVKLWRERLRENTNGKGSA
jgi:hypothetical protein